MPVMDGIECFQEIRKIDTKIPVLALTAFAANDDKEKTIALGFKGYISKPVKKKELLDTVAEILNIRF